MITTDIKSPIFRIFQHKNVNALDQNTLRMCREDWYPVGGIGRKGNDWVQVMVREGEGEDA